MNRFLPIGGAILSGLCLFVAVQHAVFLLAWIALVPVLVPLIKYPHPSPFRAGLIVGATLACCAFAWMVPGVHAFTGLSYGYGVALFLLCTALFSVGCATLLWLSFRLPHPVYMACIWLLAEALLQWAAGSLPWFLFHMGNALSANLYAIQPASVTGVTGLSFVVVLVNCLIAQAIVHRSYKRWLLPCSLFVMYMCWGWWLLVSFDRAVEHAAVQPTFRLSILQQNSPPEIQWDQANGNALVQQLLQEERRCMAQKPNLILWSESAIPWTYAPEDDLVQELLRNTDPAKITHILGMNTTVTDNIVGNSAYCLLPGGKLAGRYDKRTPLLLIEQPWNGWLLPFFSANGYSVLPGNNDLPLPTPYGKAGILICNESVLPSAAAATVLHGAQFLLNMSNDGWFRNTWLVSSHFYNARLRAVETRKDLAINSNNGQCGLVDASGRIDDTDPIIIRPNNIKTMAVRYPALPVYISLLLLVTTIIIHQKTKST
jgi:apolipoprotein N-acyltransferase